MNRGVACHLCLPPAACCVNPSGPGARIAGIAVRCNLPAGHGAGLRPTIAGGLLRRLYVIGPTTSVAFTTQLTPGSPATASWASCLW